ncbi:helix-turn-helix transcriptional regulator [bacterium]|nr:helix-turn-helix transcriptional regulator [candidate division CSSED10-310 bacterium]
MDERTKIKRFLPMSETAFYILLSLITERHGYGIMQEVERVTTGRIKLGAGTLYGSLQKMEKEKLIRASGEVDRRKLYELTALGREVLRLEVCRLEELLKNGHLAMEGIV